MEIGIEAKCGGGYFGNRQFQNSEIITLLITDLNEAYLSMLGICVFLERYLSTSALKYPSPVMAIHQRKYYTFRIFSSQAL